MPLPLVIPALQQWTDNPGTPFQFSSGCSILSTNSSVAETFRKDLLSLTGINCNGTLGNIQLQLLASANPVLGTEGYLLEIKTSGISISGNQWQGIFYGTRTILQMLKQSNGSYQLPLGSALDYPKYPIRGQHMDMGRLFVTTDWLINHIKELAYLKMNIFHWHLAEWNNFRLQSLSHPEITATQYYNRTELAQMIAIANEYFVTIVPEIEGPGHMNWLLQGNPNLRPLSVSGTPDNDNVDLTNPRAYTVIQEIFEEFLPLFPGPWFHIGTDEYITNWSQFPQFATYAKQQYQNSQANEQDIIIHYVNWLNDLVRSYGKTTWAWDDMKQSGAIFSVNKNIILDSWTNASSYEIQNGYKLINSSQTPLYPTWYQPYEPMQTQLYERWQPNQWSLTSPGPINASNPNLLGAKLEWWFDNNLCEQYSMAYHLRHFIRTVAQKTWGSPLLTSSYEVFKTYSDVLGHAPQTTFPTSLPPLVNIHGPYQSDLHTPVVFNVDGTQGQNGATIVKYNWNFGDGGSSTVRNPSYTYRRTGNFQPLLIVTDNNGKTTGNMANVSIVSNNPPSGPFTVQPLFVTLQPGQSQTFVASAPCTWKTNGTAPISSNGLFTVPLSAPNDSVFLIIGTSVSDPTQTAVATVHVGGGNPSGTDLAQGHPSSASSIFNATYGSDKAFDGNDSTRWCARQAGNNEWLQVDLGSAQTVGRSSIKFESTGVWKYKLDFSSDGTNWSSLYDNSGNTQSKPVFIDTFPPKQARYVRATITTTQPGHWASVITMSLYSS